MKKIILALFMVALVSTFAYSADGDVDAVRVIPDAVKKRPTAVRIDFDKQRAVLIYKEVDADGNYTGVSERVVFVNVVVEDDPETTEVDESTQSDMAYNKFNRDLVEAIVASQTAGDNARKSVRLGIKSTYVNK